MGIEQGLFLFVYLAHSLTPEVVLFFFIFLVVVLFFPTCVCTGNLCVCVSARKRMLVARAAPPPALGLDLKTTRRFRLTRPFLADCSI